MNRQASANNVIGFFFFVHSMTFIREMSCLSLSPIRWLTNRNNGLAAVEGMDLIDLLRQFTLKYEKCDPRVARLRTSPQHLDVKDIDLQKSPKKSAVIDTQIPYPGPFSCFFLTLFILLFVLALSHSGTGRSTVSSPP